MAERFSVHHGSMLDYLPTLAEGCIDACVSDPPYELGFMGRKWDKSGIAFQPETWAEVLRVLKPGSHLIAFGGTRTFHRIACAIEDAGFDIRDSLAWLHGQGFPKSLSITDKIGTALKPAFEPIIVARKPCDGTIKETFLKHGTGGLNIDACRVAASARPHILSGTGTADRSEGWGGIGQGSKNLGAFDDGRWPPNTVLSHSDGCERIGSRAVKANPTWDTPNRETESTFTGSTVSQVRHGDGETEEVPVFDCVEGCPVRELDEQSGVSKSGGRTGTVTTMGYGERGRAFEANIAASEGTASRFFPQFQRSELDDIAPFKYAAKPSRSERDNGLSYFRARSGGEATGREDGSAGTQNARAGAGRNGGARNVHPTVKGIDLMRWLVRLVTPPGGLVLDPFTGSGTTGVAAMLEGLRFCGCELNDTDEEPFVSIATARMRHVLGLTTVPRESIRAAEPPRQGALF